MDYMETIKQGLRHTWNNKFMWVLGFLAALGGGSGYSSNTNYTMSESDMATMAEWATPERIAALTTGFIAFACIAFILGLVLWVVSLAARGGMIGAVAQMETGSGKPNFRSAFRMGWSKVLRLIGMTILMYIVPIILFIILAFTFIIPVSAMAFAAGGGEDPSAIMAGLSGLALLSLCLLCLLIPLTIVLSFIYPFAFRGVILRDLGIRDAIRHGWRVLRGNLGDIILLGLAFFLINLLILLVVGAILVPVGLVVGVPFVALMNSDATFLQGLLVALGLLIGLIVFAVVGSLATAWQSSTFTVAYLQWTGKEQAAGAVQPSL